MKNYDEFKKYLKEVEQMNYLESLVYWELHVSCSKSSKDYLLDVITELSGKLFELTTNDKYGTLLSNLINDVEFSKIDEMEQKYFNLLYERYNNFKKIPVDFYKEYTNCTNKASIVWEEAK